MNKSVVIYALFIPVDKVHAVSVIFLNNKYIINQLIACDYKR